MFTKLPLQNSFFAIAVISLITIFSSCSRVPEETNYIPKEAAFVADINCYNIREKVNWDSLKQLGFFNQLLQNIHDSTARTLMNNPDESGVDFSSPIFCFFRADKMFGEGYTGIVAALTDENKFENTLKQADKNIKINTDNDIHWATLPHDAALGWNGHIVILLASQGDHPHHDMDMDNDSTATNDNSVPAGNITDKMKSLFHLEKDEAVSNIAPFAKLQKKSADMSLWINIEQIYKGISLADNPMLGMMLKPEIYEGYYVAATANFDKGQIKADADIHANDKLSAVYKNLLGRNIDESLIKNIPSKDVDGLLAFSFKPEGFRDLFTLLGIDGFLNAFLSQQNLTQDDILKAIKGDMIIAVTDLSSTQQQIKNPMDTSQLLPVHKPKMNWLIAFTIGDNNEMNKLLDKGVASGMLTKNGNNYQLANGKQDMGFVKTDKLLTIASSTDFANQYIAGNVGQPDEEILHIMKGKYAGLYINLQEIIQAIRHDTAADSQGEGFKDMYFTSEGFSGDIQHASFVLRFTNPQKNSLTQLLNISGRMYEKRKNEHHNWHMNGSDSTMNMKSMADTTDTQ